MSVISFRARETGAVWLDRLSGGRATPQWYRVIDGLLAAYVLAMLVLMSLMIGREVIPYHLLFLGLTLVYGFRVWPLRPTLVITLVVTATTGWILVDHQLQDGTSRAELAEVPLMPLLFLAMVWHARRRVAAQQEVELMAEERLAVFEREREFFREASHAMRTPVTIAVGHLELLEPIVTASPEPAGDYAIVVRQMGRLSALSTRLLALAKLDSGRALRHVDLDLGELLSGIGRNWRESADRDWAVDRLAGARITADPDWLELAVDALIENAVHFTVSGDRIRLSGETSGHWYVISVADAGPGVRAVDLPHVFERFWHRSSSSVVPMGSGLGLPMALAAVRAHGGRITASTAPEGGALFEVFLRIRPEVPATS
jgi:signal transduction histidine kinase